MGNHHWFRENFAGLGEGHGRRGDRGNDGIVNLKASKCCGMLVYQNVGLHYKLNW